MTSRRLPQTKSSAPKIANARLREYALRVLDACAAMFRVLHTQKGVLARREEETSPAIDRREEEAGRLGKGEGVTRFLQ